MFSRDQTHAPTINMFSVPTSHRTTSLQNRHMVRHEGEDNGQGTWVCSKDKEAGCTHVSLAQDHLQRLLHSDSSAQFEGADVPMADSPGKPYPTAC